MGVCEDECADARRRRRRMPEEASEEEEEEEDSEAVIFNIGTYCYWSGLRVRQMGLPPEIGFVNTTGAKVAQGKLVCTTEYSFLMKLIRKTLIPLFRKYQS